MGSSGRNCVSFAQIVTIPERGRLPGKHLLHLSRIASRKAQPAPPRRRRALLRSTANYDFEAAIPKKSHGQRMEILGASETWVAVNKPAGVLIHRTNLYHSAPGERYLMDYVAEALEEARGTPVRVFPVQRLDRPTSGVLLFAIGTSENASRLQNALQSEQVSKEYWALAFGADMPVKWTNDHPLRDLTGKARRQRTALTYFEQMLRLDASDMSIVRAWISTGRRHQIRRHLSNSKHPIVGDTSHGKGALNRQAREKYGVPRCCLHSRRLTFLDPDTGNVANFEARVPTDMRNVLGRLSDYSACDHERLVDLGDEPN